MLVIAHRGASANEPENTLRAIARAIALGADWVEIDVQRVDNALIVIHDDSLDRTTNGQGPVSAQTLAALRALDAGRGERIPLLTEVIDLIDARIGLNIELKGADVADDVIALVSDCLRRQPAWHDRLLLSSFDAAQTARAARGRHGWRLGVLFEGDPTAALERAVALRADSLHVPLEALTAELVTAVRRAGVAIYVYTVNADADLARCLDLGVDGVFSDVPERALTMRAEREIVAVEIENAEIDDRLREG